MLLLTFPSGSFPAGTVMGWPESPEGDKQEHAKFSQHRCFGVPTQPAGIWLVASRHEAQLPIPRLVEGATARGIRRCLARFVACTDRRVRAMSLCPVLVEAACSHGKLGKNKIILAGL